MAAARDEIARIRAAAAQRAASLARAQAAQRASLSTLRSRMAGWEQQVRALQAAMGTPGNPAGAVQQWFDGFAIPKDIVMCESGGNYGALNPSSGAGGAYQMLPETYKGLGGQVRGAAPRSQVGAGPPRREALGGRPGPRQLGVLRPHSDPWSIYVPTG